MDIYLAEIFLKLWE